MVDPDQREKSESWSAAIDALAAGRAVTDSDDGVVLLNAVDENAHRLFVVSAGNVGTFQDDHWYAATSSPSRIPHKPGTS